MSQHPRLGEASPAKGLDERVLRLVLQFSGLETPSANSEQSSAADVEDAIESCDAHSSLDEQPSDDSYDALSESLDGSDGSQDGATEVNIFKMVCSILAKAGHTCANLGTLHKLDIFSRPSCDVERGQS